MALLALTVIGAEKSGLVSSLADVVSSCGGNWEHSQMTELAGRFAGIVTVDVPDERADELIEALRPLDGLIDVTAQRTDGSAQAPQGSAAFTLDLTGHDRPGIVAEVTAAMAHREVTILRLETDTVDAPMAGGRLFEAHAELRAPSAGALEELKTDLERLAGELMVDIEVVDTDQAVTEVAPV